MTHEKVFVRDNGTKVKIQARLMIDYREEYWNVEVWTCKPRKRTWINVHSTDDYSWRNLDITNRELYVLEKQFQVCSDEEIKKTKEELWMKLKP